MPAKKTHKQFVIDLHKVHGDSIKLAAGAVYTGSKSKLDAICGVCNHQWLVRPNNLLNGQHCPKCKTQRDKDSWGKVRRPRGSASEKAKARQLRAAGWSYPAIGKELGRAFKTIQVWCDPEQLAKQRALASTYHKANREQKRFNSRRYSTQTPHGKAAIANTAALRRYYRECDWITLNDVEQQRVINYYQCRNILNEEAGYIKYHVDHIYPLVLGGAHEAYNLRLLKAEDNLSKGKKLRPEDWALYQQRVAELFQDY